MQKLLPIVGVALLALMWIHSAEKREIKPPKIAIIMASTAAEKPDEIMVPIPTTNIGWMVTTTRIATAGKKIQRLTGLDY